MDKREKFITKARKTHGDRYDYSKVEYIDSKTKVCIICPEHGEFWQEPAAHVRGYKCPLCANINRGSKKRWSKEKFIEEAIKVHGDKYGYSKVDYVNASTPITIICPIHGEFMQAPTNHLMGQGCPKCSGKNLSQDEIISMFKEKHGDKYDYSKVHFNKMHDKVCIICPDHGEFWQTPSKHLLGQGCPVCRYDCNAARALSKEEFIKRAIEIHGDKYDYSEVQFNNTHDKIAVICKKHGNFTQYVYDHLNGHGCPRCANLYSKDEDEIYMELCNKLGWENVVAHDRTILDDGKEIDIYIPSKKIGIEYNGLRWHSEAMGKDSHYHISKTKKCEEKGIRLIQIFEDEYKSNKELVIKKILHILGVEENLPKIMGRKCAVSEISMDIARPFLNENHIQGYTNATKSIGAYFNGALIGVMSFTKTDKENEWVLTRFATDNRFICQGIGGKMFSYFVKNNNPYRIKSFADRRWSTNGDNLYAKLGFTLAETLKPDYRYVDKENPKERIHKFNLRKKEIHRRYNLDMNLTERQMVEQLGLTKIWDCGLYRYEWKKETEV